MKFFGWLRKKLFFWEKRRKVDKERKAFSDLELIDDQLPHKLKPQLRLIRTIFTNISTIGQLLVNGEFECWILEDPVRKKKIPKITAIPTGTYEIVITHSPKFQRKLPLLKNVPNYRGIRIHPGNNNMNTEGCLLPGKTKSKNYIGLSRDAFRGLNTKIEYLLESGKVMIEIVNEREAV